ncbi:hypothetical protein LMIY3S_04754 [Labrys miyagiensis]
MLDVMLQVMLDAMLEVKLEVMPELMLEDIPHSARSRQCPYGGRIMTIRYRKAVPVEPITINRKKVEDAIEKLIMLLDFADPDPDLEDVDDDTAVDDRPCDDYDQDLEPEYGA